MENLNRNVPGVFKAMIDNTLIELAGINGKDTNEVKKILSEMSAEEMSSYWYLRKAATKTIQWAYKGKVEEILNEYGNWGTNIFEPSENCPFLVDDYEDDMGADTWPVYPDEYPEEAREALSQDFYLGGGNGDVLGIWKKGVGFKVYVATPHEFEVIAEDPVEWLEKTKLFVLEIINRKS